VIVAILLPIATPGFTKGLVGVLGTVGGNGSGDCAGVCTGKGGVDLSARLAGQLNADRTTAIATIQTDDTQPEYLTFAYATQLTNQGFFSVTPTGTRVSQGLINPYEKADGITFTQHHATITLKDLPFQQLPVYEFPQSGTLQGIDDRWLFDALSGEIFSLSAQTSPNMRYSFDYSKPHYTPQALRTAPPIPQSDTSLQALTHVPQNVKAVDQLVNNPKLFATNEYDRLKTFRMVRDILEAGFIRNLVLSHDVCYRSDLATYGGAGYTFLSTELRQYFDELGLSEDDFQQIMVDNPRRALTGAE